MAHSATREARLTVTRFKTVMEVSRAFLVSSNIDVHSKYTMHMKERNINDFNIPSRRCWRPNTRVWKSVYSSQLCFENKGVGYDRKVIC